MRNYRGLALGLVGLLLGAVAGCTGDGSDLMERASAPNAPRRRRGPPACPLASGCSSSTISRTACRRGSRWPASGTSRERFLHEYTAVRREYALSYAGNPNWSDFRVSAQVVIDDDRQGQVGIVGRGDSDHYYFELVLGRSPQGQKSWAIRQRQAHRWTTLGTGPFDYELGTPYMMRLSFRGVKLGGSISRDMGRWFTAWGRSKPPPVAGRSDVSGW